MNEDVDAKLSECYNNYQRFIHRNSLLIRKYIEIDQSQSKDIKKIQDDLQEKIKRNEEALHACLDWINYYSSIKIISLLKSI